MWGTALGGLLGCQVYWPTSNNFRTCGLRSPASTRYLVIWNRSVESSSDKFAGLTLTSLIKKNTRTRRNRLLSVLPGSLIVRDSVWRISARASATIALRPSFLAITLSTNFFLSNTVIRPNRVESVDYSTFLSSVVGEILLFL